MEHSIFMDKASSPRDEDLKQALGTKYELWKEIRTRVFKSIPMARKSGIFQERSMAGASGSRIKKGPFSTFYPDKMSLGWLLFLEGRGIRIPVPGKSVLKDIFSLIDIKLAH